MAVVAKYQLQIANILANSTGKKTKEDLSFTPIDEYAEDGGPAAV